MKPEYHEGPEVLECLETRADATFFGGNFRSLKAAATPEGWRCGTRERVPFPEDRPHP
jgi:hypothetical protein